MHWKNEVCFIDTNVFIYAAIRPPIANDSVTQLQKGSQTVIRLLASGQLQGVTSLTVLQEILYLMARWARQRQTPELYNDGRKIIRAAMSLVNEVLTPTPLEFNQAIKKYGPKKDLNDLLIYQTMLTQGIEAIITANKGFASLNVKRLDPVDWA